MWRQKYTKKKEKKRKKRITARWTYMKLNDVQHMNWNDNGSICTHTHTHMQIFIHFEISHPLHISTSNLEFHFHIYLACAQHFGWLLLSVAKRSFALNLKIELNCVHGRELKHIHGRCPCFSRLLRLQLLSRQHERRISKVSHFQSGNTLRSMHSSWNWYFGTLLKGIFLVVWLAKIWNNIFKVFANIWYIYIA